MTRVGRRRGRRAVLALALSASGTGALWYVVPHDPHPRGAVLLFALAAVVGEFLPLPKPHGRGVPMSVAVIAAFALLENEPWRVAAVAGLGWSVPALAASFRGEATDWIDLASRVAGSLGVSGLVGIALWLAPDVVLQPNVPDAEPVNLAAAAMVWVAVVLVYPLWESVEETARTSVPTWPYYRGLLAAGWLGGVALAASATLGALVRSVLGLWTLPLLLLPLFAARVGLSRFAEVRRTIDQTVRAMSRLPEELGTVRHGHGERVGDLAVAVARDLGLPAANVASIERAAHLHELGRIRGEPGEDVADPVVAAAGASIVHEAGSMPAVAQLIGAHRSTGLALAEAPPGIGLGARVVRTVCDLDRLLDREGCWTALERVATACEDETDRDVLRALVRVLQVRGLL